MTRPGIEPRYPGPLTNTQPIRPMGRLNQRYLDFIISSGTSYNKDDFIWCLPISTAFKLYNLKYKHIAVQKFKHSLHIFKQFYFLLQRYYNFRLQFQWCRGC